MPLQQASRIDACLNSEGQELLKGLCFFSFNLHVGAILLLMKKKAKNNKCSSKIVNESSSISLTIDHFSST